MPARVSIIGDGQMALVMADALAYQAASVRIWGPLAEHAQRLNRERVSFRLPDLRLDESVEVISEDSVAFANADLIISAIPTQFLRDVWRRLAKHAPHAVPIVSVTKGLEINTFKRPTEVICESLQQGGGGAARGGDAGGNGGGAAHDAEDRICVLSGPSIAAELVRRLPASLVAACGNDSVARRVQELLNVPWLRIYSHDDVIGVEMAGATKNVIALAAGMVDGLRLGDNAKSALLARGLAEIARLGVAMGAKLDTFFGIAGVGDLATTCFSPEGRNRTCGERLGRGEPLEQILTSMSSVVEGVPTCEAVVKMAAEHGVEMPITAAIHAILFEGLKPHEAIQQLMTRELKAEQVG